MDIVINKFYDANFEYEDYYNAQVKRHGAKLYKKRKELHYVQCADGIIDLVNENSEMICIGTRNNHERDVWRKSMGPKNVRVFSLDIAPLSGADFIMDFNCLPEDWINKWDILFSNSLDHALDASDTFNKWLNVVKPNGLIIVGFDRGANEISESDCCKFDSSAVDKFMKEDNDNFSFIKEINNSYIYYVLRKK